MLALPHGGDWAPGSAPAATAVLVIWGLQTIPNTLVNVAFPVLMDGASGSSRRLDLLSRRWSIMGLTTAVTVALAGQMLGVITFPFNYALVFGGFALAAVASWWNSHRIRLPDQDSPRTGSVGARTRLNEFVALVRAERRFLAFEARAFLYTACLYLAAPLLPLYYVRELHAPDVWIGVIGAASASASLAGYWGWRRLSRRRGTRPVLLVTILGSALAPASLTMLATLPLVVALAAVTSVFAAGASLLLFEELMRRVPPRSAVTFTAIDQSTQNLAATLAPIASVLIATAVGVRPALLLASVMGVMAFGLFVLEGRSPGVWPPLLRSFRPRSPGWFRA